MKWPVALQLYSIRREMEADFAGTLRTVKALGYDGVEFAGLYGRTPSEVRELCGEIGLTPISAHVSFGELTADPEGVLDGYAAIGCRFLAIPSLPADCRPGRAWFTETAEQLARLGKQATTKGIRLLYHNHSEEFELLDGRYALDVLFSSVPAAHLQTELDTCWVSVGGEEPAAYLKKYRGRAPAVHLHDFVIPGQKPSRLQAFAGGGADGRIEFRPLGMGSQDLPALLSACEEAGAEWLIVEQDDPTPGTTALACAGASRITLTFYMEQK